MGGALASQRVDEFWRNTASALNSIGDGTSKEAHAWKTYWHELKYRARKRDTEIRQHARGTGGGPAKKPLTVTESRILQLLGTVSYAGNPEVQIPLNLPNMSSSPAVRGQLPAIDTPSTSREAPLNLPNTSSFSPAVRGQLPASDTPSTSREAPLNANAENTGNNVLPNPPPSLPLVHELHNAGPSPPPLLSSGSSEDSVPVGPRRGRTAAQVRNTRPYRRLRYDDPPEWARRYEEQRLRIDRNRARLLERLVEIAEQALGLYRRSLEGDENT